MSKTQRPMNQGDKRAMKVRQDATIPVRYLCAVGIGREMPREEMEQETKSKEGARAQPCATHSRHSKNFPIFRKYK